MADTPPSVDPGAPSRLTGLVITPRGAEGQGHSKQTVGSGGVVPFTVQVPTTQTVDAMQIATPAGGLLAGYDLAGNSYQSGVPGAKFCVSQVTVTAAQLIAMYTTPVSILPAPAAGVAIVVDAVLLQMKPTATQFTSGGLVSFVYHGTAVLVTGASDGVPATTIKSATASNNLLSPVQAVIQPPAATGVDITNATGVFATGTGTAIVTIWYWLYTQG